MNTAAIIQCKMNSQAGLNEWKAVALRGTSSGANFVGLWCRSGFCTPALASAQHVLLSWYEPKLKAADPGLYLQASLLRLHRNKNVVKVATNPRKLRKQSEQKGEKTLAGFCYKLLLFSGLGRLRQVLANLVSRLQSRCSPS